MGLFKRKVLEYDTEASLPAFEIDANGFIIFKNKNLGGCGIFEIIPCVTTESMTHTDSETHDDVLSDEYLNTLMEFNGVVAPNIQYDDARKQVYPAWISFLNSLQPKDEEDDLIHVQILVKKVINDEWKTKSDFERSETEKAFADTLYRRNKIRKNRRHSRKNDDCIKARWNDYDNLLQQLSQVEEAYEAPQAYKAKMYLIVSYTPSSEGWWFDGRDSDYYVTDNNSATNLFQDDKWADRIASFFMKKNGISNTAGYSNTGMISADELFWIHSDITAQIIETRMERIEDSIGEYRMNHRRTDYPFMLRRLEGIESAGLISMFPNIMSHYWDEMWNINTNIDDVLYKLQYDSAIKSDNADIISGGTGTSGFMNRNVKMNEEEANKFLKEFADNIKNNGGPKSARQEYVDSVNIVSKDEINRLRKNASNQNTSEMEYSIEDIWGDFGDGQLPDCGIEKTQEQKDEEFIRMFRNRPYTIQHQLANEEIFKNAEINNNNNQLSVANDAKDTRKNTLNMAKTENTFRNELQRNSGSSPQDSPKSVERKVSTKFGTENAAIVLEMDDENTSIEDMRDIYMGKKPRSSVNKPKFRPDN